MMIPLVRSLLSVIVLSSMLLWLFISAYLVLLGGALNVALTRRKPAKITTVVSSARAKL